MGIGGKAKYYGHDLTKEAWNRSWKRQELLAGQSEEEEMYSGGSSRVCGDYGKGCPKCKNGKRKGLQREAQRMGRYMEHKTRLGRASKAMFLG